MNATSSSDHDITLLLKTKVKFDVEFPLIAWYHCLLMFHSFSAALFSKVVEVSVCLFVCFFICHFRQPKKTLAGAAVDFHRQGKPCVKKYIWYVLSKRPSAAGILTL